MKFIKWNFFAGKEIENEKEKDVIIRELTKEYMRLENELKQSTRQERLEEYRMKYL